MTPGQIEAQTRLDTQWQRPTWPLGRLGARFLNEDALRDPLAALAASRRRSEERAAQAAPTELRQPLSTLGLDWPVTLDVVKTRYKELAKRNHPDANGGDRAAEERLKTINIAYAAIRTHLSADPQRASHDAASGAAAG